MRAVVGWIGQVVAWTVILFAVAAITLAVLLPRLGGATPYTILTGSMQPKYPPGTLVVAKPVDPTRLRVGDVVTYQIASGEPEVVTHRIVNVATTLDGKITFQTQGDANNIADDPWVMPVQIRGRLWYAVPYLGRLNILFSGHQHQVLVDGAAILLIGYATVMFAGAVRERVRAPAQPAREREESGV